MAAKRLPMPNVVDLTIPEPGGCWLWTRYVRPDGYGEISRNRRKYLAHRLSYEQNVGPIPDGLVIDHVKARGCRFKHCVRPDHLEAVTQRENVWRGDGPTVLIARANVCKRGHVDDFIVHKSGGRRCRLCQNELRRRYRREGRYHYDRNRVAKT